MIEPTAEERRVKAFAEIVESRLFIVVFGSEPYVQPPVERRRAVTGHQLSVRRVGSARDDLAIGAATS